MKELSKKYHNGLLYSSVIIVLSIINFLLNFFEIELQFPEISVATNDLLYLYLYANIWIFIKNTLTEKYGQENLRKSLSFLIKLIIIFSLIGVFNLFIANHFIGMFISILSVVVLVLFVIVSVNIWRISIIDYPNIKNLRRFLLSFILIGAIPVLIMSTDFERFYSYEIGPPSIDFVNNIVNIIPFVFLMKFFKKENEVEEMQ